MVMTMIPSHSFHDSHDQNCDCPPSHCDSSAGNARCPVEYEESCTFEIPVMMYRLESKKRREITRIAFASMNDIPVYEFDECSSYGFSFQCVGFS